MPEQSIRLIVGLGNPGPKYKDTRHNAGFWFVDLLTRRHGGRLLNESKFHGLLGRIGLAGFDLRLLQPLTYMNRSGRSVAAVVRYFDIAPERMLVVGGGIAGIHAALTLANANKHVYLVEREATIGGYEAADPGDYVSGPDARPVRRSILQDP